MKYLIFMILPIMAIAYSQENTVQAEHRHQISFGSNYNVGWGGSASSGDTDSKLIDEYDFVDNDLNFNYLHTLGKRAQVGFSFTSQSDITEIEVKNGSDTDLENRSSSFYLIGVYNFSDNLREAYYAGLSLGKEYYDLERRGGGDQEYDLDGVTFFLGKRWSLAPIGIENLSYSPMLSFKGARVNGDLEDEGVDHISTIRWDFIKLDLLF